MNRFQAIGHIMNQVDDDDLVLSTTGMISREVFTVKDRPGNFYMIGSMGLLGPFGLGLARLVATQKVYVLDGDGSALMGLGTLALIAYEAPECLVHIVLDNEAYESTGAQPSISSKIDIAKIGEACGYRTSVRIESENDLERTLSECSGAPGPHLIVVKVGIAPVEGIARVSYPPTEIRDRFKGSISTQDAH